MRIGTSYFFMGESFLSSWARVFPLLCELRHIALPRIDLLCRFSLDCDPSPMTGPFLRSAHPPPRRRTRPCAGPDCPGTHGSPQLLGQPAVLRDSWEAIPNGALYLWELESEGAVTVTDSVEPKISVPNKEPIGFTGCIVAARRRRLSANDDGGSRRARTNVRSRATGSNRRRPKRRD